SDKEGQEAIAGLQATAKELQDTDLELENKIAELAKNLEGLTPEEINTKLAALAQTLEGADPEAINAAIEELRAKLDDAVAALEGADKEAQEAIAGLQDTAKELQDTDLDSEDKIAELEKKLEELTPEEVNIKLEELAETLEGANKEAINAEIEQLNAKNDDKDDELEGDDKEAQEAIAGLQQTLKELKESGANSEERIETLEEKQDELGPTIETVAGKKFAALEETVNKELAEALSKLHKMQNSFNPKQIEAINDFIGFLLEKVLVHRIELANQNSKFIQLLCKLEEKGLIDSSDIDQILKEGARTQENFDRKSLLAGNFMEEIEDINNKHGTDVRSSFMDAIKKYFDDNSSPEDVARREQEKADTIANYPSSKAMFEAKEADDNDGLVGNEATIPEINEIPA
ncbi:MAG TPA: hypothetical protein QKA08_03365, partial [Candidatus Megaira endosymbiont of Nemacystus decipiens]|nr:hypothetical protein [Candidatus Megaera endosymbiont of Nemacystus decipiens]